MEAMEPMWKGCGGDGDPEELAHKLGENRDVGGGLRSMGACGVGHDE